MIYLFCLIKIVAHEVSNNGSIWTYNCKFHDTPKIKRSVKARVTGFDGKWFLQSVDKVHSCEPNRARVIAEHLRHQMKEIVRKNPTQAVGQAVRDIRVKLLKSTEMINISILI